MYEGILLHVLVIQPLKLEFTVHVDNQLLQVESLYGPKDNKVGEAFEHVLSSHEVPALLMVQVESQLLQLVWFNTPILLP